MFTKEQVREELEKRFHHDVDLRKLEQYIKICKVDPFVEDNNHVDYYDEESLVKLHHGIVLMEEGCPAQEVGNLLNSRAMNIIKKTLGKNGQKPKNQDSLVNIQPPRPQNDALLTAKIVADMTNKLMVTMSDSVAEKVMGCLKSKSFTHDVLKAGKLLRDNELMAHQIEKLLEMNKNLKEGLYERDQQLSKFKNLFGILYLKVQ